MTAIEERFMGIFRAVAVAAFVAAGVGQTTFR
jgi:hypothetical protein